MPLLVLNLDPLSNKSSTLASASRNAIYLTLQIITLKKIVYMQLQVCMEKDPIGIFILIHTCILSQKEIIKTVSKCSQDSWHCEKDQNLTINSVQDSSIATNERALCRNYINTIQCIENWFPFSYIINIKHSYCSELCMHVHEGQLWNFSKLFFSSHEFNKSSIKSYVLKVGPSFYIVVLKGT